MPSDRLPDPREHPVEGRPDQEMEWAVEPMPDRVPEGLGAEERVTGYRCENGHLHPAHRRAGSLDGNPRRRCLVCESEQLEEVPFVPASSLADLQAERDKANEALRECTRLSGADLSDGVPTWPPLPQFAVEEVRRLRADYDECPTPEDLADVLARLSGAEEALRKIASATQADHATATWMIDVACDVVGPLDHPSQPKEKER